ncbi:MAG: fasciclin domain-containing protein [Anaerolineae bacterium]|nr:fasciclin domain-containing protein [Anaerolineae bacterium]
MRKLIIMTLVVALLGAFAMPATAQQGTIVDVAVGNADFETLVAAVIEAGLADTLSGPGPYTVFAPTDAAFEAYLNSNGITAEQLLASPMLRSILLYHVVPGNISSGDVASLIAANGGRIFPETALGSRLLLSQGGSVLRVNGSIVIAADVQASNGVIHVIDRVLIPSGTLTDVVGVTSQRGEFTILKAAIEAAGYVGLLNNPRRNYTVLAPTDAAFRDLLNALGVTAEELLANRSLLREVLAYHVIPGEVFSTDVLALGAASGGSFSVETLQGGTVNVAASGDATNYSVRFNNAGLVTRDVLASNGVIHIIDAVLLPGE